MIIRLSHNIGRYKWANIKNNNIPKMLPYVPGAIGSNPIPKPVTKNNDGLEKTLFNVIFIFFLLIINKARSRL